MGVANTTEIARQYRHLLIAYNLTVVIKLKGFYGKGYPKVMVKVSSQPIKVDDSNYATYDW